MCRTCHGRILRAMGVVLSMLGVVLGVALSWLMFALDMSCVDEMSCEHLT